MADILASSGCRLPIRMSPTSPLLHSATVLSPSSPTARISPLPCGSTIACRLAAAPKSRRESLCQPGSHRRTAITFATPPWAANFTRGAAWPRSPPAQGPSASVFACRRNPGHVRPRPQLPGMRPQRGHAMSSGPAAASARCSPTPREQTAPRHLLLLRRPASSWRDAVMHHRSSRRWWSQRLRPLRPRRLRAAAPACTALIPAPVNSALPSPVLPAPVAVPTAPCVQPGAGTTKPARGRKATRPKRPSFRMVTSGLAPFRGRVGILPAHAAGPGSGRRLFCGSPRARGFHSHRGSRLPGVRTGLRVLPRT